MIWKRVLIATTLSHRSQNASFRECLCRKWSAAAKVAALLLFQI
jgi:hypothetical protein